MLKIRAFFDATGAFFSWCWKYPTTPIENFQDARFRYMMNTDPEMIKLHKELEEELSKK
jgi:hypothetical protein